MRIVGFLLALFWATAAVAQPSGTVLINGATPVVNATNGYVAYNNNGVLGFEAGGGGTGCIISGGSAGNILYTDGSQNCLPDASASVVLGHLTLGASATLGSITLGNVTSGTLTLQPAAGAIAGTILIPSGSDTLVNLTGTQTLTNKTLTSPALGGTVTGSPTFSGNLTFSGSTLTMSGLTSGTVAANSYIGLDASNHLVLGAGGAGGASITPGTTTIIGATAPCFIANSTSTTMACDALGTGVATALGNAVNGASGLATYVLGSSSAFGLVKVDNVTITASGGVISAVGGAATTITPGTTTVVGATAPCVIENSATTVMACTAETGTGNFARATSPTIASPTITGAFTATGLVTAADLFGTTGSAGNVVLATGPSISGLTVTSSLTATGLVTLGDVATQATNTVLVNATSGTASPTAQAVSGCSAAGDALIWTTNTGFGCNTAVTAAAVPVGGVTGLGTGVATALAVNIGSAGAPVLFNGAGGTPSSITLTNATGTAASLTAGTASAVAVGGITGLGTGVGTALAINVGSAGAPVVLNGALGTPSSGTATNLSGTAASLTAGAVTTITPGTTTVSGATAPCAIVNSATTAMVCDALGTGVVTALGNAVNGSGGLVTSNQTYTASVPISWDSNTTVVAATIPVLNPQWAGGGTITSVTWYAGTGSFTANVKIGSTSVTSCSAINVNSSTATTTTCTAANTFTNSSQITLVASAPSGSPNQALVQINMTHTAN